VCVFVMLTLPDLTMQVVLSTSQDVGSLQETLAAIYEQRLVARCIRNPMYKGPGQPIP
jgi:hypothetical protein